MIHVMNIRKIISFVCLVSISQQVLSACPYFTKPLVSTCNGVKSLNSHMTGSHLCHKGTYYYCHVGQWINKGACSNSGFVLENASEKETSKLDPCKPGDKKESADTGQPTADNGKTSNEGRKSGGFPSDGSFFENPDAADWFEKDNSQSAKTRDNLRQESPPQQYSGTSPNFESQIKEHENRANKASRENYSKFSNEVAESRAAAIDSAIRSSINSGNSPERSNPNCQNAEAALLDLERYKIELVEYIRVAPPAARKEAMRNLKIAESGTDRLRAECF